MINRWFNKFKNFLQILSLQFCPLTADSYLHATPIVSDHCYGRGYGG